MQPGNMEIRSSPLQRWWIWVFSIIILKKIRIKLMTITMRHWLSCLIRHPIYYAWRSNTIWRASRWQKITILMPKLFLITFWIVAGFIIIWKVLRKPIADWQTSITKWATRMLQLSSGNELFSSPIHWGWFTNRWTTEQNYWPAIKKREIIKKLSRSCRRFKMQRTPCYPKRRTQS